MVKQILILGQRSLNKVCSDFSVLISSFITVYAIKHFKDYNAKLGQAELFCLSICLTKLAVAEHDQ